jgi:hypothetical protein
MLPNPTDGTLVDQFSFSEEIFSVLVKHNSQVIDDVGIPLSFYVYSPYGFNPSESGIYINGEDGSSPSHKLYTLKVDSEATKNAWAPPYISGNYVSDPIGERYPNIGSGYLRGGHFTLLGAGSASQKIGSLRNKGGLVKADKQEYIDSPYAGSFAFVFKIKFNYPEDESDEQNGLLIPNVAISSPIYIECLSKSNPSESGQYPDDGLDLPPNTPPITLVSTTMNSSTSNLAQALSGARRVGNDDLQGPAPTPSLGMWCAFLQTALSDYWADYLSVSKGEPTFTSPVRGTGNFGSCSGIWGGSFKDKRWKQITVQDVLNGREHLQQGDLYFFMDNKPKIGSPDFVQCLRVMNREITDPSQLTSELALKYYNGLYGKGSSLSLSHIAMVRSLVSTSGGVIPFEATGKNFVFYSIEGNGGTTVPGWYSNVENYSARVQDSNGRNVYGWQNQTAENAAWYYHNIPEWTDPGPDGSWPARYSKMRSADLKSIGATDGRGLTSQQHKINSDKHKFNVILRFMGTEQPCAVPTPPAGQPT